MSERLNALKEQIERMKEEAIREELEIRSKAAATLAEDFSLDDIMISAGVSDNGKISVYSGIKKLAAICGVDLARESRKSMLNNTCYVLYFTMNGVRFEQLCTEPGKGNDDAEK